VYINDFVAFVLPGGFGSAKNLTNWAIQGSGGTLRKDIQEFLQECLKMEKPIATLCRSPTTLAKAYEGTD